MANDKVGSVPRIELPERLARFADHEARLLRGRRVWGLPRYVPTTTLPLLPVRLGDLGLFDDHGAPRGPRVVPLARLGEEAAFLTVQLDAPHAVGLYERDAREVLPMWTSLEAFLGSLIDEGQPSPLAEVERLTTAAADLLEHDAAQAARLLEAGLRPLEGRAWSQWEEQVVLGRAHKVLGLAAHRLGEPGRARAELEAALALGDQAAGKYLRELDGTAPKPRPRAAPRPAAAPAQADHEALASLFAAVPEPIRTAALAAVGATGEPTPEAVARALALEDLVIDPALGAVNETTGFLPLRQLRSLSFSGAPSTVAPLRALKKLKALTVNGVAIKGFKLALSKPDQALFTAAKRKSTKALDAALASGASLAARNDQGQTVLHVVAMTHDLPLALHLVARGADPWAGSYGPSDGARPIGFFGPEHAGALAAAAERTGCRPPDHERLAILTTAPERGVISFERYPTWPAGVEGDRLRRALHAGQAIGEAWPGGVTLSPGKLRAPEDVELRDLVAGGPTGWLVSAALGAHLGGHAAEALELLPVMLLDEHGAPREARFALHVLAVPALELAAAFPRHNLLSPASVDDVAVHALRADGLAGRVLFRAKEWPSPVFIARVLVAELAAFSGIAVYPLRR